ncbi:MAG: DUF2628 domain-containing protein [Hyphomicrobiaceae bacterium]
MQTYTVHEPADGPRDRLERGEELVFVREGFSFLAAIFTPFWMIAHGLWLALVAYFVAVIGLELIFWAAGVGQNAAGWAMVALHLLVGFEADAIRRWTLGRRGWTVVGSVSGRNREECERRFFEAWLKDQPYASRANLPPPPGVMGPGTGGRLSVMALRPGRI